MRIVFWGKAARGVTCLQALHQGGYTIERVITQFPEEDSVAAAARQLGLEVCCAPDPNAGEIVNMLRRQPADLFVLAGYAKILREDVLNIPEIMCLNLHAGKLPEYRGSSPLNWALINGESTFGLSILKLDSGVDSGDVLIDRRFEIKAEMTILDLHAIANAQFPAMLLELIPQIASNSYRLRRQDPDKARYFHLRFPDDGVVLWDQLTAEQVHNRIRALTDPYPCARTFHNGREILLRSSRLPGVDHFGDPGRIYQIRGQELLVCAADKCLWVTGAVFSDSAEPLTSDIKRYDRLATVRGAVLAYARERGGEDRFSRHGQLDSCDCRDRQQPRG